jgi:branched-chain amino acid transport system ATP-binding protein
MAIVLVEQHASLALEFSEQAIVMDRGRIVHAGPSSDLRDEPDRLAQIMGLSH